MYLMERTTNGLCPASAFEPKRVGLDRLWYGSSTVTQLNHPYDITLDLECRHSKQIPIVKVYCNGNDDQRAMSAYEPKRVGLDRLWYNHAT